MPPRGMCSPGGPDPGAEAATPVRSISVLLRSVNAKHCISTARTAGKQQIRQSESQGRSVGNSPSFGRFCIQYGIIRLPENG